MSWQVEEHSTVDKFFGMGNDRIWTRVDFDDVNHAETEAAVKYLQNLIQHNWKEDQFKEYYRQELKKKWENDTDLQEEYPNLDDFLEHRV